MYGICSNTNVHSMSSLLATLIGHISQVCECGGLNIEYPFGDQNNSANQTDLLDKLDRARFGYCVNFRGIPYIVAAFGH